MYLAILGRNPALSLAELESVLGSDQVEPWAGTARLGSLPNLSRLGGTIKLAEIVMEADVLGPNQLSELAGVIARRFPRHRINLGISLYGPGDAKRLGMELKRRLRPDQSVRLVLPPPRAKELSTAQLKFNQLGSENPEVIVATNGHRAIVGYTIAFQDIDAYAARDQARPVRNARVGMLPPKLAQILVNLSGLEPGYLLDPFCGSGVVLQEARILGWRVAGSDHNHAMVAASRTNMAWLDHEHPGLPPWSVVQADATTLKLNPAPDAIVTESYLGPPLLPQATRHQVEAADAEVSALIRNFLANLKRQAYAGPIVLCLPHWQLKGSNHSPQVVDEINRLGYTLVKFQHASPEQLIYRRPGQVVTRRIIVMRLSHV